MAQIAIDFRRGTGWTSKLIEWLGVGYGGISHCASLLKDGRYLDARSDVLAGVPAGVHIRFPETEGYKGGIRATLEVSDEEYYVWEDNLRAKIGDLYGGRDIFGFIFGIPGHYAGQYVCSALAINALQHLSRTCWEPGRIGYVPYPLPFPAHQLSPNSALLIVATAGFKLSALQS